MFNKGVGIFGAIFIGVMYIIGVYTTSYYITEKIATHIINKRYAAESEGTEVDFE